MLKLRQVCFILLAAQCGLKVIWGADPLSVGNANGSCDCAALKHQIHFLQEENALLHQQLRNAPAPFSQPHEAFTSPLNVHQSASANIRVEKYSDHQSISLSSLHRRRMKAVPVVHAPPIHKRATHPGSSSPNLLIGVDSPLPQSNQQQRSALMAFYTATAGVNWSVQDGWASNSSECSWFGLTCNSNGMVTSLLLSGNGLAGELPTSDTLAPLSALSTVDLSNNDGLTGDMAPLAALLSLTMLTLDGSAFTSGLASLCELTFLTQLSLFIMPSMEAAPFPACIGTSLLKLTSLWISEANLVGTLPPALLSLPTLSLLQMDANTLTGTIPDAFPHGCQLGILRLDFNSLSGSIPVSLAHCVQLTMLVLNSNTLTGTLHVELNQLSQLQDFEVKDNLLSGSVPAAWGQMTQMQSFFTDYNAALGGVLPSELSQWKSLQILSLRNCNFVGSLPSFANSTALNYLDVRSNQLSSLGMMTSSPAHLRFLSANSNDDLLFEVGICNLSVLELLDLASTSVWTIPDCLPRLTSLLWLDLSDCDFSLQSIPAVLWKVTSIQILLLQSNWFDGVIPEDVGNLRALQRLDLSYCNLVSPLPEALGSLPNLNSLHLQLNAFDGTLDLLSILGPLLFSLELSNNSFDSIDVSSCPPVDSQSPWVGPVSSLLELDITYNQINVDVSRLMTCLAYATPNLTSLLAHHNSISGDLDSQPGAEWYIPGQPYGPLPILQWGLLYLKQVELQHNTIDGEHVVAGLSYLVTVSVLDISDNLLTGPCPSSASVLQHLSLTGNPSLLATSSSLEPVTGRPTYELPAGMSADYNNLQHNDTLHMLCPTVVGSVQQVIALDPTYHQWQLCLCAPSYARGTDYISCAPCPNLVLQCSQSMFAPRHSVNSGYYPWPLPITVYMNNTELLMPFAALLVPCKSSGRCNPTSSPNFTCSAGADVESFLCSRCMSGFFEWHGECSECAEAAWLAPLMLSMAALILLFVTMVRIIRASAHSASQQLPENSLTLSPSSSFSSSAALERQRHHHRINTLIEIVLFWLQAQAVLNASVSAAMDSFNSSVSSIGILAYLAAVANVSPDVLTCSSGLDYVSEFWLVVLSPAWLAVIVGGIYAVGLKSLSYISAMARVDSSAINPNTWRRVCLSLMIALFDLVYMQVAQRIFESWHCDSVEFNAAHLGYLSAAPYVECSTVSHHVMLVVGSLVFVGFSLGLPLLQVLASLSARWEILPAEAPTNADSGDVQPGLIGVILSLMSESAAGSLRSRYIHWQLLLTARDLILTSLVSLLPPASALLPLFILVLFGSLLMIHTWVRPYQSRDANLLESLALLHLMALFFAQVLAAAATSQSDLLDAAANSGVIVSLQLPSAMAGVRDALEIIGLVAVAVIILREVKFAAKNCCRRRADATTHLEQEQAMVRPERSIMEDGDASDQLEDRTEPSERSKRTRHPRRAEHAFSEKWNSTSLEMPLL